MFLVSTESATFLGLTEGFWGNVVGATVAAIITLAITHLVQKREKKKRKKRNREKEIDDIFNHLIIPFYADIVSFIDIETMPKKNNFREDRVAFLHEDINESLLKIYKSITYANAPLQKSLLSYKRLDYIDSGKGDEREIELVEVCYDFLRYIELLCNKTTTRSINDFPKYMETMKNAAMFHLTNKVYNSYCTGRGVMEKVRFPGGSNYDANYNYIDIVKQVESVGKSGNAEFVKKIEDSAE